MTFTVPWALLLLLPWVVIALWVLLATRDPAYVPFVSLWPRNEPNESNQRTRHIPPLWVIGLLLASLLVIFAAAGFGLRGGRRQMTIIIDCGLSMSPAGRVQDAIDQLKLSPSDELHVIPIPGEPFAATGGVGAKQLQFTAAPTASLLDRATRAALADREGPVVIVTDHPPSVNDSRLIITAPTKPLSDAGIVSFVAKDWGTQVQAMIRIYNATDQTKAKLRVGSEVQSIDLPPAGNMRDYFFACAITSQPLIAWLQVKDDIDADNMAFMEMDVDNHPFHLPTDASPAFRRLVTLYEQQHDSNVSLSPISVTYTEPPSAMPAIWLAGKGAAEEVDFKQLAVTQSPLTRSVDWASFAKEVTAQPAPTGAGWKTLVSAGQVALLAERDLPQRQVWVGFDIDLYANWADYVIFWTNLLDWINQGQESHFHSELAARRQLHPTSTLADPGILNSPGIYTDLAGASVAVNAEVPQNGIVATRKNALSPASLVASERPRPLAGGLGLGALFLVCLSLECRRRLT